MRWAEHVACMEDMRDPYRVLMGRLEGKIPLERPSCRWKDTIKMNIQEIEWGGIDWIDLAQDGNRSRALVNAVMNLRVP